MSLQNCETHEKSLAGCDFVAWRLKNVRRDHKQKEILSILNARPRLRREVIN